MLTALNYLRDVRIIHGDLKPENILFTDESQKSVKIIDFGIAQPESRLFLSYVQSRAYRSPETVLGMQMTCGIDMWSFGCILVEMLIGRPIFMPIDELELLEQMRQRIGMPPQHMIEQASKRAELFDADNKLIRSPKSKMMTGISDR